MSDVIDLIRHKELKDLDFLEHYHRVTLPYATMPEKFDRSRIESQIERRAEERRHIGYTEPDRTPKI